MAAWKYANRHIAIADCKRLDVGNNTDAIVLTREDDPNGPGYLVLTTLSAREQGKWDRWKIKGTQVPPWTDDGQWVIRAWQDIAESPDEWPNEWREDLERVLFEAQALGLIKKT